MTRTLHGGVEAELDRVLARTACEHLHQRAADREQLSRLPNQRHRVACMRALVVCETELLSLLITP